MDGAGGVATAAGVGVLFSVADRFRGSGAVERLGWRGHGRFYAAAFLALGLGALTWTSHAMGALFAVAWLAWAWPGWKILGLGGMAPNTAEDALLLWVRHLLMVGVVPVATLFGAPAWLGLVALFGWALWATLLGAWMAGQGRKAEGRGQSLPAWVNESVELLRCAPLGLWIGLVIAIFPTA